MLFQYLAIGACLAVTALGSILNERKPRRKITKQTIEFESLRGLLNNDKNRKITADDIRYPNSSNNESSIKPTRNPKKPVFNLETLQEDVLDTDPQTPLLNSQTNEKEENETGNDKKEENKTGDDEKEENETGDDNYTKLGTESRSKSTETFNKLEKRTSNPSPKSTKNSKKKSSKRNTSKNLNPSAKLKFIPLKDWKAVKFCGSKLNQLKSSALNTVQCFKSKLGQVKCFKRDLIPSRRKLAYIATATTLTGTVIYLYCNPSIATHLTDFGKNSIVFVGTKLMDGVNYCGSGICKITGKWFCGPSVL